VLWSGALYRQLRGRGRLLAGGDEVQFGLGSGLFSMGVV
jgi:hypothetical protein